MPAFKDHFSTAAAGYAAHRPRYPQALADFLADAAPARDLALDAGCGSGQLSLTLAERFARVVATDASAAQIGGASPHPGIAYRLAPAERSGLPGASVDLITAAQAAHWFDLDAFYAETRRVARPRAVVALISYGVPRIEDATADAVLGQFHHGTLAPYWPAERRHVEDGYRALPFPFAALEAPRLVIAVAWRLAELIGYVETWSAVRAAERAVGRAPVEAFRAALAGVWGDPEAAKPVRWPLALRVGRVP